MTNEKKYDFAYQFCFAFNRVLGSKRTIGRLQLLLEWPLIKEKKENFKITVEGINSTELYYKQQRGILHVLCLL